MRCHPCALFALAICLPAADPVVVEIALPDLAASRTRWDASLFGRIAAAPEVAPMWAALRQEFAGNEPVKLLLATWPQTDRLSFQWQGVRDDRPVLRFALAGAAAAGIADRLRQPGPLAGLVEELPLVESGPIALVLASPGAVAAPTPPIPGDLLLRWSGQQLAFALAEENQSAALLAGDLLADGSLAFTCAPEGLDMHLRLAASPAGLVAADRAALARVPATADAVLIAGLDGPAWWAAHRAPILTAIAQAAGKTPTDIQLMATTPLTMVGVPGGLDDLAKTLRGTVVAYVDYGLPTIGLPRNPELDALMGALLRLCQQAPPKAGEFRFVLIPGALTGRADISPLGLAVGLDAGHWWLGFDSVGLADQLAAGGRPAGFEAGEAGRKLLAAPPGSHVLGAVRSRDLLRSLVPMIGLYASIPERGRWAGPALHAAWRLVSEAGVDTIVGGPAQTGWELRSRGSAAGVLGTGAAPLAIIAAIAIPNLLESRITANEAASAAMLKSGIFPAQVQFQGGSYQDADQDNIGEYGLLGELSGRTRTSSIEAGQLRLLAGPLATGPGFASSGYNFAIWLPDGAGGAISDASDLADRHGKRVPDANDQERYFVAYAWPQSKDTGRRMFALCQDGQLRSLPWDGKAPAWNAVFGGADFTAEPVWPPYRR
jgi:hypothetical protein